MDYFEKYLEEFFDSVCTVTEDLGTCVNPEGHLHRVTPAARRQLTQICAKKGRDLTPDQIKEMFTTIENMWGDIVDCDASSEEFVVRGNIFAELNEMRRRAAIAAMFHKETKPPKRWGATTLEDPAGSPARTPTKLTIKEPNLMRDRREKVNEWRKAGTPIALEEATGYECEPITYPVSVPETYFCGRSQMSRVTSPDSYNYEGFLRMRMQTTEKDHKRIHKIRQEFLDGLFDDPSQGRAFEQCLKDQLGVLPSECGSSFDSECESAGEIRKAFKGSSISDKSAHFIGKGKKTIQDLENQLPTASRAKKRELEEQIRLTKRWIRAWENLIKNKHLRDNAWWDTRTQSLDRGFFFGNLGILGDVIGDDQITNTRVRFTGGIVSPIHEFLSEDLTQVRQFVSEAIYACAPPEARVGKRKLEFFTV